MVRISEELVRRRAEHNDGILHNLRELTLHQFEIEKIEMLGTLCRHLEILYLQNNLIGRIENLNRLKELQYLNLAVNNIQLIEGLDRCESLQKLDLTLNFIPMEHLEESCQNLLRCPNLRELYLMGNPLTKFPNWRLYVVAKVPQLQSIDCVDIQKSERILARQRLSQIQYDLDQAILSAERSKTDENGKRLESNTVTEHSPEERTRNYRDLAALRQKNEDRDQSKLSAFQMPADPIKQAQERMIQAVRHGRDLDQLPRQHNQGRWTFVIDDDTDDKHITVSVNVPKYLDTSEITVDVHPGWIQCLIKGKSLVLHLPVEVNPGRIRIQRIITTGQLVIIMTRTKPLNRRQATVTEGPDSLDRGHNQIESKPLSKAVDFRNIVKEGQPVKQPSIILDDADVPPLE